MHEALLYALVPSSLREHTLKILAGVSAMQPIPIQEHHLVFKPTRSNASLALNAAAGRPIGQSVKPGAQIPAAIAQAQTGSDLFYLQLVGDLTRRRSANGSDGNGVSAEMSHGASNAQVEQASQNAHVDADIEMLDAEPSSSGIPQSESSALDFSQHPWTLEFKNLPDVLGKRPATSRLISSIPIRDGNPRTLLGGLGYTYSCSYIIQGDRFTHGSIAIRLFQTSPIPNSNPSTSSSSSTSIPNISFDAKSLAALAPLDPAGSYTLETAIRVTDGSKPELMNRALAELSAFRDLLKGVVDLAPVERLVLDPRVRSAGSASGSLSGAAGAGARQAVSVKT